MHTVRVHERCERPSWWSFSRRRINFCEARPIFHTDGVRDLELDGCPSTVPSEGLRPFRRSKGSHTMPAIHVDSTSCNSCRFGTWPLQKLSESAKPYVPEGINSTIHGKFFIHFARPKGKESAYRTPDQQTQLIVFLHRGEEVRGP